MVWLQWSDWLINMICLVLWGKIPTDSGFVEFTGRPSFLTEKLTNEIVHVRKRIEIPITGKLRQPLVPLLV